MVIDSTIIKSMLYDFGPLERWDVKNESKGKRFKAIGFFLEDAHAQNAATSLNNAKLPFFQDGKLFVQVTTSVRFKVSNRVYDVVKKRIESEHEAWKKNYLRYFDFPSKGFHHILKLEGEDRKLVGAAQKALERIIGGDVMRLDGKDIWCTELRAKGKYYKQINKVQTDLGVVITRDIRTSQFRVFGPKESYEGATRALQKIIQSIDADSHPIMLTNKEVAWASTGGFRALTSALGPGKVAFNAADMKITIYGSDEEHMRARRIMNRMEKQLPTGPSNSDTDCSVCYTEAEEPIRTSCKHLYCGACFVNMCDAEASKPATFRVVCCGNEGNCEKVLGISEIHNVLLSEKFEDILGASFVSYVRQHPDRLRYCPTPDCSQIYRVTSKDEKPSTTSGFTCTKCFQSTCTACHDQHPGKTCAEHKGDASGGIEALNKAKEEMGVKDCPGCGLPIQKSEGCNHMTCRCGTHICWLCLATFSTDSPCYEHMRRVHGGIQ